ncbi:uncharacterized protein LOC114127777 isoform X2 [Aphis gossypii]|uniref:uncharacterized protein LOC114127777 isoform X2 n=1 Tax=Aphis gossypii TaxID=80765 RepID=UPI002158AEE7|nr:uncharacterized protein LOC114127777 isoform X2 [Aphis gossypii]
MASTSTSEMKIDNVHGEIDIWSVGKCVICNKELTGESKMLECLHFICKDCIAKENFDSDIGVKCKCLTVTKDQLIDYHIGSSNLNINKDHNPNALITYPIVEEFPICPTCTNTHADVYCIQCSIMLCQFCHSESHPLHNYKVLKKYPKEINSNVFLENFKLELNNKNLDISIKETEKQIENFKIQKTAIYEEIDKETEKLHNEINKRAFELKYLVDNCFLDTVGETYKNIQTFKDLQNKNKYYTEITKSVLNDNNLSDILNVSRVVLPKLKNINNNIINISEVTSKREIDLKNNFEETMNNCISTIKELGNIITSPVFSLSKTKNINTSKNVGQTLVNLQILSKKPKMKFPFQYTEEEFKTNSYFNNMDIENMDRKPIEPWFDLECVCCFQLGEKLIKCDNCNRSYHHHCHVPTPPDEMPIEELDYPLLSFPKYWKCTMCKSLKFTFPADLELQELNFSGVLIGEPGRMIIERILMELLCESYNSIYFRECPCKKVYATFYEKISNPISLNIIKNRLESNTYYTTLAHVIDDLKQVFLDAMMFFHPTDGYYTSANLLLHSLNTLISKWIPDFDAEKKLMLYT